MTLLNSSRYYLGGRAQNHPHVYLSVFLENLAQIDPKSNQNRSKIGPKSLKNGQNRSKIGLNRFIIIKTSLRSF